QRGGPPRRLRHRRQDARVAASPGDGVSGAARRAVPLAPAAAAAWAAAAAAGLHPDVAAPVAGALWAAAVGALAFAVRRRGIAAAAVALAAAALVTTPVGLARPARQSAASFGVQGGRAVEATAVVTWKVAPATSGALWFDADATRLTAGDRSL